MAATKLSFAREASRRLLSVGEDVECLLGFSREAFLAGEVRLQDRIHPADRALLDSLLSSDSAKPVRSAVLRLRHADGRIRCIKAVAADAFGQSHCSEWLLQDVESLAEPEDASLAANFKTLIEHTNDHIYVKNRNLVFLAASRAMEALGESSQTYADFIGKTDYDLFPEPLADISYALEQRALAEGCRISESQQGLFQDGSLHWFDNRKYPVSNAAGEVIGIFGIAPDITDRKRSEDELHEHEAALEEAQRISHTGSYVFDAVQGIWESSPALDEVLGIGPGYDRSLAGWLALIHPEDRERRDAYRTESVRSQSQSFTSEYRIVRPSDGAVRWISSAGRNEFDAQGNLARVRGTLQDLTERKLAEAAMREREEVLKEAQEIAGLGSFEFDLHTQQWNVSGELDRILGIDESYPRTIDGVLALVHPEDRAILGDRLLNIFNGTRTEFDSKYRIVRKCDGAVRWIHTRGRVKFDQNLPMVLRGTIMDITERKQSVTALRESQEKLQIFIENAPVALAMFDREMRYLAVSRRWAMDHAIDEQAIIGRSHYEINAEVPERWLETHRRGLAGETLKIEEDAWVRADGSRQWIRWQIIPWRTTSGEIGGIVMFYEDITARKQTEAALRESQEKMQLFIEHAPAALAMFDRNMRYLAVSRRWMEENSLLGREFIGHSHYEIVPDVPERWREVHRRGLAGEKLKSDEERFERADGGVQWIKWEVVPWRAADGSVGGIILFAEDITAQKETEERLRLAATVFTHAAEGITIADAKGDILEVNEAFTRITGYSREEVVGRNPSLLQSGLQSREFYKNMWRSLVESGQWSGEIWNRSRSGDIFAEFLAINAIRDGSGNVAQYVGLFSDVTRLKEQEHQLETISHYDALTGLPNRVLLADRLRQGLAHSRRHNQFVAVAYLDLDRFKAINDQHGAETGDLLLTLLAKRIQLTLGDGDTLARLGGDEFAAVILDLPSAEDAIPAVERLLKATSRKVRIGAKVLRVSASIGVTIFPQTEETDADQLLRQAAQAMYQAKLAGRNCFHLFDPAQDITVRSHHESVEQIRRALARHEFVLYYQPQVNMRTGQIIGAEALIRWQHPERGLLAPGQFLPVIEDHPLAIQLGEWVIDTALAQAETWQKAGLDIPVAVNVGAIQLQQPNFVERLRRLLGAHPQLRPNSLQIEVVETSALQDILQTSRVLEACEDLGVSFSIDDFGTGYSSLTYLKRLPAKELKLDQSFVRDLLDEPENLAILEGVLGLATAFRRQLVAEGVETVEHGVILLQLGCELAQGFGIAHPMPAADLREWARTWRPDPRWTHTPAVDSRNRSLRFACVEHRAWVGAFESFLQGKRHSPPAIAPGECRFGAWLEAERRAGRGRLPWFHAIEMLHSQFHTLAAEILELHSGGQKPAGLDRLNALHGLHKQFLAQLTSVN